MIERFCGWHASYHGNICWVQRLSQIWWSLVTLVIAACILYASLLVGSFLSGVDVMVSFENLRNVLSGK